MSKTRIKYKLNRNLKKNEYVSGVTLLHQKLLPVCMNASLECEANYTGSYRTGRPYHKCIRWDGG
jgi:hypothetical protein